MILYSDKENARFGGITFFILCLLVFLGVVFGAVFYIGGSAQTRYAQYIEEGRQAVADDRGDLAVRAFTKARSEYTFILRLYQKFARMIKPDLVFIAPAELTELIVVSALMEAYYRFFKLERGNEFVKTAEENLKTMPPETAAEYKSLVATARAVDNLIELFQGGRYDEVMKELLKVEKNALSTDQDFFITEVRLMIACGKALKEPAILDRARELLFSLAYELKISNDRIDKLWLLVNR